jgi:hypothetical protein
MKTVTDPAAAYVHRVRCVSASFTGAGWQASITCRCNCWSRAVGPYCSEFLARRVARGFQRRHRRLAERGVLTVTDSVPGYPEIVAVPDDERAFMREAARAVRMPPPLVQVPASEPEVFSAPVMLPTEIELHEATLADLELLGERMPA